MDQWIDDIERAIGVASVPGREHEGVAFVEAWCAARPWADLRRDVHGNVLVKKQWEDKGAPLFLCAHLDHPGFVVEGVGGAEAELVYRGGDSRDLRAGSRLVVRDGEVVRRGVLGEIIRDLPGCRRVRARFDGEVRAGSVAAWDVGPSGRDGDRLFGLACDDMVGVGVCLQVLEAVRAERIDRPVRLIFTRAEESGMLGAIGLCQGRVLGEGAMIVCVDAAPGVPGSGVTGVGAAAALTRTLVSAGARAGDESASRATEALAFGAFGHDSAALLIPVEGMHNQSEAGVCAERVAVADVIAAREVLLGAVRDAPRRSRRRMMLDHWRDWSSILG